MASKNSKENARILAKGGSLTEPTIDLNNYSSSLSVALMYYNNEYTLSDYKISALEYASTIGMNISRGIAEYNFRGVGAVCRLILRGCAIKQEDIDRTISKLYAIQVEYDKNKISNIEAEVKPKVVVVLDTNTIEYKNSIEDVLIQNILDTGVADVPQFVSCFVAGNFTKIQSNDILAFINQQIAYYDSVYIGKKGSDSDFIEAWSHVPLTRIKLVIGSLKSLLSSISVAKVKEKVAKVISRKKELSPMLQTKDMLYAKSHNILEVVHPQYAIHASEIWIYDIESRDISVIRAMKDLKISAKGMTFYNIDENNSFRKKLRKPDEMLHSIIGTLETPTKKTMNQSFIDIKTTQHPASGRMNEFKVIFKVFK